MNARQAAGAKGGPLALFVLVMAGWVGARAMVWEGLPMPVAQQAELAALPRPETAHSRTLAIEPPLAAPLGLSAPLPQGAALWSGRRMRAGVPGRQALIQALGWAEPARTAPDTAPPQVIAPGVSTVRPDPMFSLPAQAPSTASADRWTLDGWGFVRQGSDAAPISQGRVPIYGASQIGAIGQFRLAPQSRNDPRLYLRAYQALVARGESEGALGASVRPFANVPLRTFAELRYLDAPFGRELRPSLFLVSELPPQALPADFTLEAYGQAGWVGGAFATAFADGQVSLARELARVTGPGGVPLRISAGAGAWGGAQSDAQRLDMGPTLRVEWRMGRVPARLSVDWREQVAGDAAPESGLAATLSTSF